MFVIKIEFKEGSNITTTEDEEWYPEGLECGVWEYPFPNEKGNSTAFGLIENFGQSDEYSMIFSQRTPIRVTVTNVK